MIDDHRQTPSKNSEDFLERLQPYPQLRAKFEALLDVVENASGDVLKADEAEERVFEEIRQLGLDALQAWAERKHQKLVSHCDARSDVSRKQKKNSTGRRASARLKFRNRLTDEAARVVSCARFVKLPGWPLAATHWDSNVL